MHLGDGELRAYLDGELQEAKESEIRGHLSECSLCRNQLKKLAGRASRASDYLARLKPLTGEAAVPVSIARAKLERFSERKENYPMFERLFARRFRPAWAALTLVLILGIALMFPQVRAIANNFLGLFRVQQIAVIQVNPGELTEQMSRSSELATIFAEEVQVEEAGELQEVVDVTEASALAGIPVRLPEEPGTPERLYVTPGGKATFTIDVERMQALLDEIGRADIRLPKSLDGAEVTIKIPTAVMADYGTCFDAEQAREEGYDPDMAPIVGVSNCTTLAQMPSPEINAPPGLDVNQIGEIYLQVLGMGAEEAAEFSQNIDWTTTLVIPIPRHNTDYQSVQVDGVTGTLISQRLEDASNLNLVIWVKDGIVYAVTSPGTSEAALRIANSLK